MRSRQLMTAAVVVFIICAFSLYQTSRRPRWEPAPKCPITGHDGPPTEEKTSAAVDPEPKPASRSWHPMSHLIEQAERDLEAKMKRQSRTLAEAVAEYRRRYKIPPPPHFDKWFAFAQRKNVQLVDEFDTIFDAITPFWGLKPETIRARAKEALGFKNALMGIQIRKGAVSNIVGAQEWQQEATQGMMKQFIKYLPDMDLAFNIHDEPRVVVPHDDMARLVSIAKNVNMPAANSAPKLRDSFTAKPAGLNDGTRFEEFKVTRFNVFAHQPTWTHSRLSCPPDSPARVLDEDDRVDDRSKFALGELGFVYNDTAMSDICISPSLGQRYGFFNEPNAYNIVHDLFPIFSQSKISSYADLIYPSPWYWFKKVGYDEEEDMEWAEKKDQLYWRGSTTGGFSRGGGWRRQHRQRLVEKVNAVDKAQILSNHGRDTTEDWQVEEVPRGDYRHLIDVYFSHIGQCDEGDCEAQKEFFDVHEHAEQKDAWQYKYLLDMDGNAFSGRFYAFLKSKSLVYKFAIFREWHSEWIRPWAHYIPLSFEADEWLEAVRFFHEKGAGEKEAERLALQGRQWANKVLRNEDLEVWFFRLLLEYGRVIDDNRETIGFF